jgi:uncharacterized Zn-finger protein
MKIKVINENSLFYYIRNSCNNKIIMKSKEFICDFDDCTYKSGTSSNLKRHILTHTKEKNSYVAMKIVLIDVLWHIT